MAAYHADENEATNTVIGIVFGVLLLLIVLGTVSCCLRGKKRRTRIDIENGISGGGRHPQPSGPHRDTSDWYIRKPVPKLEAPDGSNEPNGLPPNLSNGPDSGPPQRIPAAIMTTSPLEGSESDTSEETESFSSVSSIDAPSESEEEEDTPEAPPPSYPTGRLPMRNRGPPSNTPYVTNPQTPTVRRYEPRSRNQGQPQTKIRQGIQDVSIITKLQ